MLQYLHYLQSILKPSGQQPAALTPEEVHIAQLKIQMVMSWLLVAEIQTVLVHANCIQLPMEHGQHWPQWLLQDPNTP